MLDLKDNFEAINQELLDQNFYVENPYQGDPVGLCGLRGR
jgi:hypothetical protein